MILRDVLDSVDDLLEYVEHRVPCDVATATCCDCGLVQVQIIARRLLAEGPS